MNRIEIETGCVFRLNGYPAHPEYMVTVLSVGNGGWIFYSYNDHPSEEFDMFCDRFSDTFILL